MPTLAPEKWQEKARSKQGGGRKRSLGHNDVRRVSAQLCVEAQEMWQTWWLVAGTLAYKGSGVL